MTQGRTLYVFTVEGPGVFPIDMLRHDRCWPSRTEDSLKIVTHQTGELRVTLQSEKKPVDKRWRGHEWSIIAMSAITPE